MIRFQLVDSETDLSTCLALRHEVFVDEQKVPVELEIDEHDHTDAIHLMGLYDEKVCATGRVCVIGDTAKIQRVAVAKEHRGKGLGKDLMIVMLDYIRSQELAPNIALDAQTYAASFYEALGFKPHGEEFDDAGIPHIHMRMEA